MRRIIQRALALIAGQPTAARVIAHHNAGRVEVVRTPDRRLPRMSANVGYGDPAHAALIHHQHGGAVIVDHDRMGSVILACGDGTTYLLTAQGVN